MKVRPFRIPKHIVMPGVVIQVDVVAPSKPDLSGDTLRSSSGDFEYDPRTGRCRIRINSTLPLPRQRVTLIHELQHFMTDYLHVALTYHRKDFQI